MYKASMDNLTKGITIVVCILLLSSGAIPLFADHLEVSNLSIPSPIYVMPIAFIILLVLTYGFSPKAYELNSDELVIVRPFGNKRYAMSEIRLISAVDKSKLKGAMRIFGVGGLFGYFGLFRNSTYGTMIWHATRRDHFVVIERLNGKSIVLTPDDPASLVSNYQLISGK